MKILAGVLAALCLSVEGWAAVDRPRPVEPELIPVPPQLACGSPFLQGQLQWCEEQVAAHQPPLDPNAAACALWGCVRNQLANRLWACLNWSQSLYDDFVAQVCGPLNGQALIDCLQEANAAK